MRTYENEYRREPVYVNELKQYLTKGLEEEQGQGFRGGRKRKDGSRKLSWDNCSGPSPSLSTLTLLPDGTFRLEIIVDKEIRPLPEPRIVTGKQYQLKAVLKREGFIL